MAFCAWNWTHRFRLSVNDVGSIVFGNVFNLCIWVRRGPKLIVQFPTILRTIIYEWTILWRRLKKSEPLYVFYVNWINQLFQDSFFNVWIVEYGSPSKSSWDSQRQLFADRITRLQLRGMLLSLRHVRSFSYQSIYLNKWPEIPRPPVIIKADQNPTMH